MTTLLHTLPLWRFGLPPHVYTLHDALTLPFPPRVHPLQPDHYHDAYLLGLWDGSHLFSPHYQSRFGPDSDGALLYTLYCLGYLRACEEEERRREEGGESSLYPGINLLSLFGLDTLQSVSKQLAPTCNKLDKISLGKE